ncbi:MAG: hypothetical protein K6U80_03060 [Firmicutes bacterium]|nr:hypothetical protein [Bacillota bacterium]
MSQGRKGRLNYRCPACFIREIDVDMFYDREKEEYYCLRCPFTGTEEEALKLNELAKFRYKNILTRITEFD